MLRKIFMFSLLLLLVTAAVVMVFVPRAYGAPNLKKQIQFIDEFGDPVNMGTSVSLYIYDTGGTTEQSSYLDKAGGSAVTQPVTDNSTNTPLDYTTGLMTFWSTKPAYKLVVTDGTYTRTIDNLTGSNTRFAWPSYLTAMSGYALSDSDDITFGTGTDWAMDSDTAERLDMIPAADGSVLAIGDGTYQADVYMYSGGTTKYLLFDEGNEELYLTHIDIQFDDNSDAIFGSGNDFVIESDTANTLEIIPATQGNEIRFGATNATSCVMTWYSDTSGDTVVFDEENVMVEFEDVSIALGDATAILLGDTIGTGDFSIAATSAVLAYTQVVADTGTITYGADGTDIPITWYAETASSFFKLTGDDIQVDAMSLCIGEGDQIQFGDALGTGDMQISCTSNVLTIGQIAAGTGSAVFGVDDAGVDVTFYGDTTLQKTWWDASGDEWFYGDDGNGVDVTFYGDTVSSYMKWDENGGTNGMLLVEAADIALGDSDLLLFGDAIGTGDIKIYASGTDLIIDGVVAETGTVAIGLTDVGLDFKLWAATNAEGVLWDASDEALEFTGANITLDATSELYDAVLAGTKVVSGIPVTIVFRPDAAATLTWTVPTGYDLIVTDAIAWKTAGAGAHADDEWSLQHNDGSAANIFDKEELNTIADKARILFDNLDDSENELEAGETLDLVALENAANGCDGIIIVSGYLKTAD